MLIAFSGLPGTGKSTVAKALAKRVGATYLRIDTIEDELICLGGAGIVEVGAGYQIAYKIAEDNLQVGRIVVADAVNPISLTRDAWKRTARRSGASILEVYVLCSNVEQHKQRINARPADGRGAAWSEVSSRHIEPPLLNALVIDTARGDAEEHSAYIERELSSRLKIP